jgi:hypothetical protein
LQLVAALGAFERALGTGPDTNAMWALIGTVIETTRRTRSPADDLVIGRGQGSSPSGKSFLAYLCIPGSPYFLLD